MLLNIYYPYIWLSLHYKHLSTDCNEDFYKKLYVKKEFNKNKIDIERRSFEQICNSKEFKLLPQQKLLKNYLSINTPYNSLLIFHGTGVGKTCTAISIAEGFKDLVTDNDKRFIDGYADSLVFDENAYSIMNFIDDLTSDDSAEFFPLHEDFNYKRIGAKREQKTGLTDEEKLEEAKCRQENIKLMDECINDAKILMSKQRLKPFQSDLIRLAISLFEKRAGHAVYWKESKAKEKFDELNK